MKFLQNRPHRLNTRFLHHETGSDERVDSIAEELRSRTEKVGLSDQEIHDLAHIFADLLENNENFATAFEEAIGEEVDPDEVDTWQTELEAYFRSDGEVGVERLETEETEESKIQIPLTTEEFDDIYKNLDTSIHIPDELWPEIEAYILHNLETSADPEDEDNTERLTMEQITKKAEEDIESYAIFLKAQKFYDTELEGGGQVHLDGSPVTEDKPLEDDETGFPETVGNRIDQVAEETGVDKQALLQAMAGNVGGFGLDDEGHPLDITPDSIGDLATRMKEARETVKASGVDPESPQGQAMFYNQAFPPGQDEPDLWEAMASGNLKEFLKALLYYMFKSAQNDEVPTDSSGRPLGVATPNGNYEAATNSPNHVENTKLNENFYGAEMVAEFRKLPEADQKAAAEITEDGAWGPGDLESSEAGKISGWKLAVMRHAVTRKEQNQPPLTADKPFFANDLALRRAIIYIPGRAGGPILTTCVGGSGKNGLGISNVSGSNGSPLGSFYFKPETVRDRRADKPRYAWSASVHGMEPMDKSFRVSHEEGANIDPSSGNTNTAGRAVLMHGVNDGARSTWGCWGVPRPVAEDFAAAIKEKGGANGEAFLSIS